MVMEKRVPIAGNMEKVATSDLVEDPIVQLCGDEWTMDLPKSLIEPLGEDAMKDAIESFVDLLRLAAKAAKKTE